MTLPPASDQTPATVPSGSDGDGRSRRTFRWLMLAQTLSLLGDSLLAVALALFVLDESGSPALSAATALARIVPAVLFSAVGGALVDRSDRRRLLWRVTLLRAVLVMPLILVVEDQLPLYAVLALELLRATLAQLTGPAVGASLPVVVAPDDLPQANAKIAARNVVVQLAAPTLGAALYAAYGLGLVVVVNAVAYLAAGLTWLTLPKLAPAPRSGNRVWADTLAGLRLVKDDDLLRPLLAALALSLVGLSLELAVLVPFIRQELQGSARSVGMLTSLEAVGGLVAAIVFTRLHHRLGIARLFKLGMWGMPIATCGFLVSRSVGQAVPGVVAAGFLLSLLTAALQVHLQQSVTRTHLGRVLGILGSTIALAAFLGTSIASALTLVVDLRIALATAVFLELAGIFVYLRTAPPSRSPR